MSVRASTDPAATSGEEWTKIYQKGDVVDPDTSKSATFTLIENALKKCLANSLSKKIDRERELQV
jgi:hypothetical protein